MRKFSLPLLFLFSALVLFFSCRKTDGIIEEGIIPQLQDSRFFNVPATASPQAKAIAEAIKKQDAKFRFVSDVIKKAGYPIWDKARIHNNINRTVSSRSA